MSNTLRVAARVGRGQYNRRIPTKRRPPAAPDGAVRPPNRGILASQAEIASQCKKRRLTSPEGYPENRVNFWRYSTLDLHLPLGSDQGERDVGGSTNAGWLGRNVT